MYTCNETQGGVYLYPLPCQPRRRPSCAWRGVRLWRIAQVRQGSIFLLRTLYSDFHFDNLPLIVEILRTMHNLSNHHRGAFSFCHPDAGPGAEDAELRDRSAPRPSLSAYARNRPPLWKPVRQMPRDMQRWGVPPTTVSYCELRTLRRNSALSACERRPAERPGRHGGSLAAVDELWPALPTKVVKLYGSYTAYCTSVSVRRRALSLLHRHG
jgi:hypothetical protein